MKHAARGVIRLNDSSSHGGYVITASGARIMGLPAALAGDMLRCPQCKGDFAILPDGAGPRHQGRTYAYHGDLAECGARLVTSLK